jgi:D-glycero-D-manno-heptose 1,7-bisphosphate phosphatase
MLKNKLVILDRDGVINHDSDFYIKSPEEWIPIESSLRAIAKLNLAGYKVAVATNQSGIGRGMFNSVTLTMIHKKMEIELAKVGAHVDALEYCPDHPDNSGPNRKPKPGMINKILKQFDVDPIDTFFIGDSISDVECAKNAGCVPVLVLTGKGKDTINRVTKSNLLVYKDLSTAIECLLSV